MSLINTNGQPITPGIEDVKPVTQRVPLTPADAQQLIGAYARFKELSGSNITSPKEDAERNGLVAFITGKLFAHAEEFFGCWVTMNQEYIPLVQGFTSLLNRSLARIDAQHSRQGKVQEVVENK